MELSADIRKDDYRAFVRFVRRHARSTSPDATSKRQWLILMLGWFALVGLFVLLKGHTRFHPDLNLPTVITLVFVILVFVATFLIFYRQAQNQLLPSMDGIVLGPEQAQYRA